MAVNYVQIFIDCEAIINNPHISPNQVVHMYAKPEIVVENQGGYELGIKVPNEDIIEWRTYPEVVNPEGSDEITYDVIVDARHDWDSAPILKGWSAHQGDHTVYVYDQDDMPMNQDTDVPLKAKGAYQPFVRATATYPGERPDPDPVGVRNAYTFYIDIFKNGEKVVENWSWDPYVTVFVPVS